ncbi:hypothetical protein CKCBHOJB_02241 [Thauera sp. GDN1]|nr:hypothetical protein CKCBHOJB_02241 [Thauera sp. GDN1]
MSACPASARGPVRPAPVAPVSQQPDAPPPLAIQRAERWFDRLRGLLGSPPPAPGHALLIAPCASVHTAFMRYPIDVVFLDRRGRILEVIEALPPWRMAACWRARQTLELAAGEARRLGLAPGTSVVIPDSIAHGASTVGAVKPAPTNATPASSAAACASAQAPSETETAARRDPAPRAQRGATLVEFVVAGPLALFILLVLMQYALLFHARSQLNYAAFEAARAGTVANARLPAIRAAFDRAMTGYHGGGTTTAELAAARSRALAEAPFARIEILSPTRESFDDYHSPALAARMGLSARVIPNTNLAHLDCPVDRSGCARDPAGNASGQTLQDANLLKLRITYGIPVARQIPLAGPFMARALAVLDPNDGDAFRAGLVAAGRIPVVTHTVMRMQSPAIEAGNASLPGPGNAGTPSDPGPPPEGPGLPACPLTDPACTEPPAPVPEPEPLPDGCNPLTDPACSSYPSCQAPADWLSGIPDAAPRR